MLELLNATLKASIVQIGNHSLRAAAEYALFPAGKRFRPLLLLILLGELKTDIKLGLSAAASIELLHVASLIHDDLPALDNDDERRGRATVHKQFSESTAILIGDLLPQLAISLVSKDQNLENDLKVFVVQELSEAYVTVMEGQQDDLEQKISLSLIHEKKTSALFQSTIRMAIALSGKINLADFGTKIGKHLGVCFQYLDDFIDRYGSSEERGRSESSDSRNHKQTVTEIEKWKVEFNQEVDKLTQELSAFEAEIGYKIPETRKLLTATLSRSKLVQISL